MREDAGSKLQVARDELTRYHNQAPPVINACINEPAQVSRLYRARELVSRHSVSYEPYSMAAQLMAAGMDHLAALLILWNNEEIPHFACYTVTRGLLEASSRAVWLLDASITENQCTSRGVLEYAERLWNKYRLLKHIYEDARRDLDDDVSELVERAVAGGLPVEVVKSGERRGLPTKVGAEVRPGPTAVIDLALEKIIGTGAENLGIYSLLSGFAHSDSFVIIMDAVTVGRQAGVELRQSRANLGLIADLAVFSAAVHRGALELLAEAAARLAPSAG